MKEVLIFYTGTWNTMLEVPDDWELTQSNVKDLIERNAEDFDFSDGGANWEVHSVMCADE